MKNLLKTICNSLALKHLTTTTYLPQPNAQAENYNRTLIERLHQYVAEYQCEWNIFVQLLIYKYITQVSLSTGTTPFILLLSRHPPVPTTFDPPSALETDASTATAPAVIQSRLLHCNVLVRERTNKKLTARPRRYKDHHVIMNVTYVPQALSDLGKWVYVDHPPIAETAARQWRLSRILN